MHVFSNKCHKIIFNLAIFFFLRSKYNNTANIKYSHFFFYNKMVKNYFEIYEQIFHRDFFFF